MPARKARFSGVALVRLKMCQLEVFCADSAQQELISGRAPVGDRLSTEAMRVQETAEGS